MKTQTKIERLAYDRDLYHRALTGRGEPIRPEEVLDLIETIEERDADYRKLAEEHAAVVKERDEAWIVPKDAPDRLCGICSEGHDRGDGRCERHGRYVRPSDDVRLALCMSELEKVRAALEVALRASSGGDEVLRPVAPSVGHDKQDGLLPESARDALGDKVSAPEGLPAAEIDRGSENLDHQRVLAGALPHAARPKERGALEGVADKAFDRLHERTPVKGRRKAAVTPALARDAGAYVEADRAARLGVAPPRHGSGSSNVRTSGLADLRPGGSAHPRSVAEDRRALKDRAGKTRGRIWLFAIIEDGKIAFETCWLPNVPEVVRRLGPVGFRRQPDGAFRASVDVRAELDIRRAVGKAFEVMLREEVGS